VESDPPALEPIEAGRDVALAVDQSALAEGAAHGTLELRERGPAVGAGLGRQVGDGTQGRSRYRFADHCQHSLRAGVLPSARSPPPAGTPSCSPNKRSRAGQSKPGTSGPPTGLRSAGPGAIGRI